MAADLQHRLTLAEQPLDLAYRSLAEAASCTDTPRRYACAHVAALRAAAALLAVRARPNPRNRQRNAWELVAAVAPEFADWAMVFAAGARKRAAAEAGLSAAVTEREADDLVREAERFLTLVEKAVGAPRHPPLDRQLRWA